MSNIKTVRVGVMPGRINEYAVEVGSTIAQVLEIAELSANGYEVKVDGVVASVDSQVTDNTNLILLAKQVKGNGMVRIGVMPGRINEFALADDATFADALQTAELSADGYEVKADGEKVTDLSAQIGSTNLILLAKQVKGNAMVRIGVMPGRINEYALADNATFNDALATAELSADGYEVKADGEKVTDLSQPVGSTNLILLAKQVKGN